MTSPDVRALLAQLGRLDNHPETINAMQRGLNAAWDALDQADGCPVIAETFAESPHTELFPPGSVRRSRRTANVGATVIHRLFHPLIKMWQESAGTHRGHR